MDFGELQLVGPRTDNLALCEAGYTCLAPGMVTDVFMMEVVHNVIVLPTPATRATLTVLKAGETVYLRHF